MAALPTLGGALMPSNIQTINGEDFTNQDVQSAISAPMPEEAVAVEETAPAPLPYANKGLMGLQYLANMKNPHTTLKDPNQGDMNLLQTILSNQDKNNPYMALANLPFMYLLGKTNAASQNFERDKEKKIAEWTTKHEAEIKEGISELERRNESAARFAAVEKKFKDSMDVLAKGIAARKSGVSAEEVNVLFKRYGIDMDTSKIPTDAEIRQKADDLKEARDIAREDARDERLSRQIASSEKRTFAQIAAANDRYNRRDGDKPEKETPQEKLTVLQGQLADALKTEDKAKVNEIMAKIKNLQARLGNTLAPSKPVAPKPTEAPKKKGLGVLEAVSKDLKSPITKDTPRIQPGDNVLSRVIGGIGPNARWKDKDGNRYYRKNGEFFNEKTNEVKDVVEKAFGDIDTRYVVKGK